ncbi:MAG: GTP cyclohydrolase I FolE [Furfurilactobacillus sp.]|jgi:GTP cyclohydrolase I|uniref:GTP cyclohydrolase 1 n=2 Tax=Furfurilactobacillus TaxID=2767882 RepID=A0A6N9I1V2_9LACO|nr:MULTISPECIES: GTP cyclohydrolase I FolE [Furfurilactobacillus]MCF6160675.1 GTP cyclohydrolase I FolE [Furfurilactobacillus milii]MCF6162907.1 GTP cyclohydrolase I FolE [Furfurilactobacillus milii]MCF6166741.1 GTP cyclohydrolase I FolE [Furfurilactobacillus rossiae]MCF6420173.1 GTP cyclohydrolase I FolE [Furfurilactobacillus milii]MCH4010443.1 GTP cyclohydrolase I FolE [Furfurilactobacillus sp.]
MTDEQQATIEGAVRQILTAVGEDPDRAGLVETPARVARAYAEMFSSLEQPTFKDYKLFHEEDNADMVVVGQIPFYSMCEHHLLPFFGRVSVAYVPTNGTIIGLSKIPRLVDYVSRRPTVQENITNQVAAELEKILKPAGVAVSVAARHMCMEMRGVNKTGSVTQTATYLGEFKTNNALRQEFLMRAEHGNINV